MLPKAPLSTTSSKSATNKRLTLDTPLQFLKGVGPKLGALLASKGLSTIQDLLLYLPRDYQDRTRLQRISELQIDAEALVRGRIIQHRYIPIRRLKRPMLEALIDDGSGATLSVKWFQYNRTYMDQKLAAKPWIVAFGTAKEYQGRKGMIHPDIEWDTDPGEKITSERIVPIYSETEGLTQKTIHKILDQAIEGAIDQLVDDIPPTVAQAHGLVPYAKAILALHRPPKSVSIDALKGFETPEQKRLIFDEFFKFEWIVGRRRLNLRSESTKPYPSSACTKILDGMITRLPFAMTGDQQAAVMRIYEDLASDRPMNRLLQGDVGCGKTLVAFATSLPVIAGGGQAALMAPTEILAEQHFINAQKVLAGLPLEGGAGLRVELLVGSTTKAKREEVLADLAKGRIHLLIGTHALIEDPVIFKELGLVVVDEQHRFGVDQRMGLRAKGRNPHLLSLTATPIPRTLALTAYGDLDVTIIRELPKGRPEIFTKIVRGKEESDRAQMFERLREELRAGHQVYVIYPLVAESEKIDLANAISGAEELANGPLRGFSIGLLHGRMRPQEKSDVMAAFKEKKTQVLVSTTVVEVGVDVPNATTLVIEHAERFGLSQLHQLRGRVGRGTATSYCFLIAHGGSDVSYERLRAMERTRDGFKLAELDLEIRGPGEFLGTRQSGELQFKYASLVRDQFLLHEARKAAFDLLRVDPELRQPEHAPLRRYMYRLGHLQESRFGS